MKIDIKIIFVLLDILKWLSIVPIFDNEKSLNILDYNNEEVIINGQGRFFYIIDSFQKIIDYIKNIKRFDLIKLDGIVKEFDDL